MQPVRTLDLSTFTGDTWAVQATAAVPAASAVQRLVVRQIPVVIDLRPRDGLRPYSANGVDPDTVCDVRVVKIELDERGVEFPVFLASLDEATGETTLLGRSIVEDDLRVGDTIAIGFPSLTVAASPAAALAVYVHGAEVMS